MRYISSIIILLGFIVTLGWIGTIEDTGQFMPAAIFAVIGVAIMGIGQFIAANYPQCNYRQKKSRRPYSEYDRQQKS